MSWDKITFICRDGCITGNRFILTNYSRLLGEALESYQSKAPLSSGLNGNKPAVHLKNNSIRDLKCLFHVLYSLTYAEVSNPRLTGLQNVARMLDIELTLRNGRNGFIRVMASPVPYRDPINGGAGSIGVITSAAAIAATSAVSRPPTPETPPSPVNNRNSGNVNNSSNDVHTKSSSVIVRPGVKDTSSRDPRLEKNRKRRVDQASQKNSSIANDGTQTDPELELDYPYDEKPNMLEERNYSVDMNDNELELRGYTSFIDDNQDGNHNRISYDINYNDVSYDSNGSPVKLRKNGPGAGLYSTKKYYTKTANKDEYTCNLCNYVVHCWTSIKAHIETQHYHLEFRCKRCPFVSVWRADIVKHIRNYHKSRTSSEDTYVTRQRKEFSSEPDLNPEPSLEPENTMEIINSVNGNEIKIEQSDDLPSNLSHQDLIEDEEEEIDEEDDLKEPLIEGNKSLTTSSVKPFERLSSRIPDINKDCYEVIRVGNKKVYQCISCAKECKTYCGIREHQYSTHYGYICICNHCDVKYRSRSNMFKHLNLAHQIVKNFTQHFGYLVEDGHQKIPEIPQESVDSSGKFKCKICSNNFSDKEIIINHLVYKHRIKSDVTPFYEEIDEQTNQLNQS
ncbi:zinc finger homeobox protein 4-like [Tetranychus urticae]|uniref:C2H2-type domain-containing protein n=1 Tax=Tetranychus urticae TaxID=32264 RepID=T1JVX2_TETUR|nr:zinc finger homeobox protein 4-like [Tetranychus urticae]